VKNVADGAGFFAGFAEERGRRCGASSNLDDKETGEKDKPNAMFFI
jgi:hypothetical protein